MSTITAPITRSEVKSNLDDFSHHWRERIDRWKAEGTAHTEKSSAQQFWSDLFRCFGIIPERIDLFERDAERASTGNTGYIDLFWSGVVLGEAKSLGRDLDAAVHQALDYLAGGSIKDHEFPKYIIVSDFERIQLTRLGDEGWTSKFTIDEITDHIDQLRFLAGFESITKKEEEEASIAASRLMADLFKAMAGDEVDEATRQKIIKAGQGVLDARGLHPERSLADHYNPLAMDPALLKAHDALDRVADKAMGAPRKLTNERQRQELLFESYARMTYKK